MKRDRLPFRCPTQGQVAIDGIMVFGNKREMCLLWARGECDKCQSGQECKVDKNGKKDFYEKQ